MLSGGAALSGRLRLPNRRASEVFELEANGLRYTASFSCFPSGTIAELFLNNHKSNSAADTNSRDAAIAFSFGGPARSRCRGHQARALQGYTGPSNRPAGRGAGHHRRGARAMSMVAINTIKIGHRHRRDLGDIDGLARSIKDIGELMHPIVIRSDGTLIAGERRLAACKQLGWTDIPVTVIDLDSVVRGEFAENIHRKDFTLSEAVAIKRDAESLEKAAAKERQREGGRQGGKATGKLPTASTGRAADKAARATGMARRTLEKAEAVVAAAEADPEKYDKLLVDMDRTGRADGPYKRLRNMQQAELIRAEPPPLPGRGPYRVIVVDPPWPFEHDDEDPSDRGKRPYPTMTIAEIMAVPVASISHEDAICWLWVTNFDMREAFKVLDTWGFVAKTILTWAKDRMGYGAWLRCQTEHCVMAVRGKPTVTLKDQTTLLRASVRANSQKPVEFYDLVESLCPAPRYADLFSRYQHNERWDCHGDEAPGAVAPERPSDPGEMPDLPGFLRRPLPQDPAPSEDRR
jgi:N6-adenosine-specific RNA methylase IME4